MKLFALLLLALGSSWTAFAQTPHATPASTSRQPIFAGQPSWTSDHDWLALFDPPFTRPTEIPVESALRKTLFDQLRAKLRVKGAVRFMGELRAFKNWALFRGEAWDANNKPIVVSWSPKVKLKDDPLANDDVAGLWLRTRAGWKLVDYHDIGCGEFDDPATQYWTERYGMPVEFWGVAEPVPQKERKTAFAFQKRVDIPPGSEVRKELFDILRPEVEHLYGKEAQFTGSLEGFKNWALFEGSTTDAKGNNIPEDGGDTVALWVRTWKGWLLVDFNLGHTDTFYEIWKEKYGAPFFK